MHTRISRQKTIWALWKERVRVCALLLMALCIVVGCGAGQTTPPPPTATSAPPTAMPSPEASPTPISMEDIAYYNIDNPVLKRTLTILHPESGNPPYPFILFTPAMEFSTSNYPNIIEALRSRGYAVVQIPGHPYYGLWPDGFCAWAWLEANAGSYGLDINRALVFSHGVGVAGSLLGLGDKSLWTDLLTYCPSPMPSTVHIRGVVTFNGWFLIPEGSLTWWGEYIITSRVTGTTKTPAELISQLRKTPYEEWRAPGQLDEPAQRLAAQLPLYYLSDPNPAGERPAFLLLHSGKEDDEIPASESLAFAAALEKGGIPVELQEIPDSDFASIKDSNVAGQIADAIDAFAQKLFANTGP